MYWKGALLVTLKTHESSWSALMPNSLLSSREWRTPSSSDSWFHQGSWWARRQNPVWFTRDTKTWLDPSPSWLHCYQKHSWVLGHKGMKCVRTNGWSFLQALRSWDSLLRAMPDIAAHQRLPVEKTTPPKKHINYSIQAVHRRVT